MEQYFTPRRNIQDKCGVYAVDGTNAAKGSPLTSVNIINGLVALQHRGQDSIGIVLDHNGTYGDIRRAGLAKDWFFSEERKKFAGKRGIGHNRYTTDGELSLHQAQPFTDGDLVFAVNGNLPEVQKLGQFVEAHGRPTQGANDSQLMFEAVRAVMSSGAVPLPDAVAQVYDLFKGAFSVVAMDRTHMVGLKDRYGVKPLAFGQDPDGNFIFSSETRALPPETAWREVQAAEMLVINKGRLEKPWKLAEASPRPDSFEGIYFMKPDSVWEGKLVGDHRKRLGRQLAMEILDNDQIRAGLVVGVPNSALIAAREFARTLGIDYEENGLTVNPDVTTRMYISRQDSRMELLKLKYLAHKGALKGRDIYVGDDSLVRGDAFKYGVLPILRAAGVGRIHGVIFSPPVISSHEHAAVMPVNEIIHYGKTTEEVRNELGLDSLTYLSVPGMHTAFGIPEGQLSTFCFTGEFLPETQHLSPIKQPVLV